MNPNVALISPVPLKLRFIKADIGLSFKIPVPAANFFFVDYMESDADDETNKAAGLGLEQIKRKAAALDFKVTENKEYPHCPICFARMPMAQYDRLSDMFLDLPSKIKIFYGDKARDEYDKACLRFMDAAGSKTFDMQLLLDN